MRRMTHYFTGLVVLFMTGTVQAADMVVQVVDAFDPVHSALTRMALIFSTSDFTTLAIVMSAAGVVAAMALLVTQWLGGRPINPLSVIAPVLIGTAVFMAGILPKSNVGVWDSAALRYQEVPGVPSLVARTYWIFNQVESRFISLVDTVSNNPAWGVVAEYGNDAGGMMSDIITQLLDTTRDHPTRELTMTVDQYVDKCVIPALSIPISGLTINELRTTTTTMLTSFAKAANPALSTVVYTQGGPPAGTTTTCAAAYTTIAGQLNGGVALINMVRRACSQHGWAYTGGFNLVGGLPQAAGDTGCNLAMVNAQSLYLGAAQTPMTATGMAVHFYLTNRLREWVVKSDMPSLIDYSVIKNSVGIMQAANSWLPYIRSALLGVTLSVIPFVLVLIMTPLAGNVAKYVVGVLAWSSIWGIMDAITFHSTMDYLLKAWESVQQYGIGLKAVMVTHDTNTKTMAAFGQIRSMSVMLATSIMFIIFRFGGHALSEMAGRMSGNVENAGRKGAEETMDPAGRSRSLEGYGNADAFQTSAASAGGFNRQAQVQSMQRATQTMATNKASAEAGGDMALMNGASDVQGGTQAGTAIAGNQFGVESFTDAAMSNTAETAGKGNAARGIGKTNTGTMSVGHGMGDKQVLDKSAGSAMLSKLASLPGFNNSREQAAMALQSKQGLGLNPEQTNGMLDEGYAPNASSGDKQEMMKNGSVFTGSFATGSSGGGFTYSARPVSTDMQSGNTSSTSNEHSDSGGRKSNTSSSSTSGVSASDSTGFKAMSANGARNLMRGLVRNPNLRPVTEQMGDNAIISGPNGEFRGVDTDSVRGALLGISELAQQASGVQGIATSSDTTSEGGTFGINGSGGVGIGKGKQSSESGMARSSGTISGGYSTSETRQDQARTSSDIFYSIADQRAGEIAERVNDLVENGSPADPGHLVAMQIRQYAGDMNETLDTYEQRQDQVSDDKSGDLKEDTFADTFKKLF